MTLNDDKTFILILKAIDTLKVFAWCFAFVFLGNELFATIQFVAGTTTKADIEALLTVNVFFDSKLLRMIVLSIIMSSVFYLWGSIERLLRKRTIRHLGSQKKKLEEQIDPSRTSSGLSSTGDTNLDDQ